MKSIFDNMDYLKKKFALEQLQATFEDKKSNKSKGQIVRRLRQEGFSLDKALRLHRFVSENLFLVEIVIKTKTGEIEKIKAEYHAALEFAKQQKDMDELRIRYEAEQNERKANIKHIQFGLDIVFGQIADLFC